MKSLGLLLLAAAIPADAQSFGEWYQQVDFEADGWLVTFAVPRNRPVGEPVSFRVSFAPKEIANPESRSSLGAMRRRHFLEWGNARRPLDGDVIKMLAGGSAKICLGARRERTAPVCKDPAVEVARGDRPKAPIGAPAARPFDVPALQRAGAPILLAGPFDGDLSNTRVRLNGRPLLVLAESRLGCLVSPSEAALGDYQLELREASASLTRRTRFVDTEAGAPVAADVARTAVESIDNWAKASQVTVEAGARQRIEAMFVAAGGDLYGEWRTRRGQFESYASLLDLMVRFYCFELRDRASRGGPGPRGALPNRFASGLAPSQAIAAPVIRAEDPRRFDLGEFLRTVWNKITLNDSFVPVVTAPQQLEVRLGWDRNGGGRTNRIVVVPAGEKLRLGISEPSGRHGCDCSRELSTTGRADPVYCNLDRSGKFDTSPDCRVF